MIDYSIFYKKQLPLIGPWDNEDQWDLFLSAYVPDERVTEVFKRAKAPEKHWLVFPEYSYGKQELPQGQIFVGNGDEATFISDLWRQLPANIQQCRLCIDISGFIRPYLIYLVRWLSAKGIRSFDAIYSEPLQYENRELTEFSDEVTFVRQVAGCEGSHTPDSVKDVLIIGAGYEDNLISHAADSKTKATKLLLIGFPSLRADMYQENMLRVRKAEESLGGTVDDDHYTFFAPANDPFVVATKLSQVVESWRKNKGISNLYLCPLSTKAHVLGFALYYVTECLNTETSIIFPFEKRCSHHASKGIARIWKYTVELL